MEHTRVHAEVVVDGHRLNFSTVGDGPPLMLIPGNCMSSERWVEEGYVDALAADFHLILFDPLGHGESEKVADRDAYRGDALTAHMIGVLDQLGIEQVAAWGYLLVRQLDDPLRIAVPAHNFFLLGVHNLLWIFRIVGLLWVVRGSVALFS